MKPFTIAVVLFTLSACSQITTPEHADNRQIVVQEYSSIKNSVSVIRLKDGTWCVIADYHGTGITCDWASREHER